MIYTLKDLDAAIFQKKVNFFGRYALEANVLLIDKATADLVKSAIGVRGNKFIYNGLFTYVIDTDRTLVSVALK